ncbi:MAG: hypothetical protein OSA95_13425, partial [Opitutales bacterium]|nr:hypothetical protein [Opitutales bacterium]
MKILEKAASKAPAQDCVLETCKYPRTCRWNACCMEGEMKKSMDAKMNEGVEEKAGMDTDSKLQDPASP